MPYNKRSTLRFIHKKQLIRITGSNFKNLSSLVPNSGVLEALTVGRQLFFPLFNTKGETNFIRQNTTFTIEIHLYHSNFTGIFKYFSQFKNFFEFLLKILGIWIKLSYFDKTVKILHLYLIVLVLSLLRAVIKWQLWWVWCQSIVSSWHNMTARHHKPQPAKKYCQVWTF